MYLTNFISQPTPSLALHDSSLTLDAIVQGLYEDFWGHFTALSMPRGDGERPDTLEVLSKLSGPVLDLTTFTWTFRISSLSRPPSTYLLRYSMPKMGNSQEGDPRVFNTSIFSTGLQPWLRRPIPVFPTCKLINTLHSPGNGSGSCLHQKVTLKRYKTCGP